MTYSILTLSSARGLVKINGAQEIHECRYSKSKCFHRSDIGMAKNVRIACAIGLNRAAVDYCRVHEIHGISRPQWQQPSFSVRE